MSGSSVGFLRRGVTRACFRWVGKIPRWRERLHRWHKIGEMVVEMRLSSHVGIGSSGQDLAGNVDRSLLISETVVGSNSVSGGTPLGTITLCLLLLKIDATCGHICWSRFCSR